MGSARVRIQRALEKYVVNPAMRAMLLAGVAPRAFALLETTGRTGKRRRTPVGNGLEGDVFWLVSEHGERCAYVQDLSGNNSVHVSTYLLTLSWPW
jgi:hypothetical protein